MRVCDGDDTLYIPVNLDGTLLPFLLDTGATVRVLPKAKLLPLLSQPLSSYSTTETLETRSISALGGHLVTDAGHYVFPIEVFTPKVYDKFYVIDFSSPFIAVLTLWLPLMLYDARSA